ncbi:hypothetical protein J6590_055409 [Homalodisca vitripennis]|nr:hypothetical protein J6590_055409 [Homalodisca vitripennis]
MGASYYLEYSRTGSDTYRDEIRPNFVNCGQCGVTGVLKFFPLVDIFTTPLLVWYSSDGKSETPRWESITWSYVGSIEILMYRYSLKRNTSNYQPVHCLIKDIKGWGEGGKMRAVRGGEFALPLDSEHLGGVIVINVIHATFHQGRSQTEFLGYIGSRPDSIPSLVTTQFDDSASIWETDLSATAVQLQRREHHKSYGEIDIRAYPSWMCDATLSVFATRHKHVRLRTVDFIFYIRCVADRILVAEQGRGLKDLVNELSSLQNKGLKQLAKLQL